MNYELAKKLKDAGLEHETCCEQCNSECLNYSLSELIEACGENLGVWESVHFQWYPNTNEAYAHIHVNEISKGSTPEEAVAKLWLVLNKK